MAYWDSIPELHEDLLAYFGRQNDTVSHVEMAAYFERLAANDGELTCLDQEMYGLRTISLQNCNGGSETLIAIRRIRSQSNILMFVAIVCCANGQSNGPICDDLLIQSRLNLGNLKLLADK